MGLKGVIRFITSFSDFQNGGSMANPKRAGMLCILQEGGAARCVQEHGWFGC